MKKLSKFELVIVGILTFSLFFGAGNLMFPSMLGKEAGTNLLYTMVYFSVTAVIFPILAVIVVTRFEGLKNLASRVDNVFALIFTICVYLAIGPALAAPRAGVLPFEIMIAPILSEEKLKFGLLIYTTIFFGIVYWFSLSPSKLLDRLGKVLSPAFLILVIALFLGTFIKPLGAYAEPTSKYSSLLGIQGFLDGYMTLDILAGLNYGLVVAYVIKEMGVKDEKSLDSIIKKTGFVSGVILFLVYGMLAHIGAITGNTYPESTTGIEILTYVSKHVFGQFGFAVLSVMFTIACLNIGIALTTSISQYFSQLINKIPYKAWVTFWTVLTFIIANLGLKKIMSYSVPTLLAIYPPAIVLVILALIDKKINGSKLIYSMAIYPTLVISIINTLDKIGIKINGLTNLVEKLPLYSYDLGWICVFLLFFVAGVMIEKYNKKI